MSGPVFYILAQSSYFVFDVFDTWILKTAF